MHQQKMILSDSPCIVDVGVAGMILAAEAVGDLITEIEILQSRLVD